MNWKDILKTEPYTQNTQNTQNGTKKSKKDKIEDIVPVPEKIKKMGACLHGFYCRHLFVKEDRQVCRENEQPVFDMDRCPLGLWETPKKVKVNNDKFKPGHCRSCGGAEFWSLGKREKLICARCHPPLSARHTDKGIIL